VTAPATWSAARSTVVTDDGAHLAVYTDGPPEADAAVVLSHGFLMTSDMWRLQTRELASLGVRVVRYDQRAHGNSTPGRAAPTIDRLGADLADVLDAAAPQGPLVLAGHSMGGMAVLTLAACRPHLIRHLSPHVALISTACTRAQLMPGNRPLHWVRAAARAGYAYPLCWLPSAADIARRRLPSRHPWNLRPGTRLLDEGPLPSRQALHHTPTEQISQMWMSLRAYTTAGRLQALDELGDRVEIVTGELDDWIPLPQTRALAQALPRARLHAPVAGAGHQLPTHRSGHTAVTEILGRMAKSALRPAAGGVLR